MPLFTHTLALDWSAANAPKRGADSIWLAETAFASTTTELVNIPTRAAAIEYLRARIVDAVAKGERLLIGCDFAFGYPAGIARAVTGRGDWQAMWAHLAAAVTDSERNESNRFDVAGDMNAKIGLPSGPFWGHPHQHKGRYAHLDMYSPKDLPIAFQPKRIVEQRMPTAKSTFQLTGAGAVGSQSILGIAALERLRRDPKPGAHIAIWPFETRLSSDVSKPITIAEIYPSSHQVDPHAHPIKDAAQVMAVARDLSYWDKTGALEDKLSAFGLSDLQRAIVTHEEGWILGV